MSIFKQTRYSQPQGPVGLDRANPATRNIRSLIGFVGGTLYDAATQRPANAATQYGGPIQPVATPGGIGMLVGANAGGFVANSGSGDGYSPVTAFAHFYVSGATHANKLRLVSSNTAYFPGSGQTGWAAYWHNTAGERKVGLYLAWNNQTLEVSGVQDGLHTVAFCISSNNAPSLYLDGRLVAVGATLSSYYYSTCLATAPFESPTLSSAGVGAVLFQGVAYSGISNQKQDDTQARALSHQPWQLFAPIKRQIWVPMGAVGGVVDVTLSPTLVPSAELFYVPTISLSGGGVQALGPGILSNTSTLFAPVITTGAVTLSPARYDNTSVFPAATVTTGAVSIAPTRLDNAASFFSPSVTAGGATLQPARVNNTSTFYAATVTTGDVTLSPARHNNTAVFYGPSVTAGGATLQPARHDNANTFYAATVTVGATTLAALRYDNSGTFFGHAVTPGAVGLTAPRTNNAASFFAPIVSIGAATVAPPLLANVNSFFSPTINTGAVTLQPSLFSNAGTFYGPVVTSVVNLAPPLLANTNTFYALEVVREGTLLVPLLSNTNLFFGGVVLPDGVAILPSLLENTSEFFPPSVFQFTEGPAARSVQYPTRIRSVQYPSRVRSTQFRAR